MRKNDLIKLLENQPGNPEVMLWNGFVADFVPIGEIGPHELVKQTFEHYCEMCRLERCHDLKDWDYILSNEEIKELESFYRRIVGWDHNQYITDEDVKEGRYKEKKIIYINAKKTGRTGYDRFGSISY